MNLSKRIIAIAAAITFSGISTAMAEWETLKSSDGDFEYTSNGMIVAYYGGEVVFVPAEIDGTPIKEIGTLSFFDLDISTIYVEDGIESIGVSAFEGCNAVYADIAESVKEIDERAFTNCSELDIVALNSEKTEFGKDAFSGTGHIQFAVPCNADRDALQKRIAAAKGNDDFEFLEMHTAFVEKSDGEKNVMHCEACGYETEDFPGEMPLPFSDVPEDSWYYGYVHTAYSLGVISGKSETAFDPDAGLTCAEAAKLAACIYAQQKEVPDELQPGGEHWYDTYVDYCYKNGIIEDYITFDWDKNATRAEMAYMFSRCETQPNFINEVPLTDIPDVHDTTPFAYEILDLYNMGIAVGSDEKYTYYPDSEIKRSEAAALISRILCPELRIELPKG